MIHKTLALCEKCGKMAAIIKEKDKNRETVETVRTCRCESPLVINGTLNKGIVSIDQTGLDDMFRSMPLI